MARKKKPAPARRVKITRRAWNPSAHPRTTDGKFARASHRIGPRVHESEPSRRDRVKRSGRVLSPRVPPYRTHRQPGARTEHGLARARKLAATTRLRDLTSGATRMIPASPKNIRKYGQQYPPRVGRRLARQFMGAPSSGQTAAMYPLPGSPRAFGGSAMFAGSSGNLAGLQAAAGYRPRKPKRASRVVPRRRIAR